MTTPIIEMIDINYRYPRTKRYVIEGLNLAIEKGEFFVLMGENGAGKSTLCEILNGIIPHSLGGRLKGKVLIDGIDTQESTIAQLSTKVGIVLEDPETQLFTSSVLNEVAFGPENLGVPAEEILERAHWALEVVGLAGFEERLPTSLSGGQKQRLAIAAAMTSRPSILVLDEATSQLDPLGVVEVMSVVRELNEKYGMTIVMATDQSEEVARVANRIAVLHEGKLVTLGTPRQIFADTGLFKRYMIRSPQVSQLGTRLQEAGCALPLFPITLDEAYDGVMQLFGGQGNPNPSPTVTAAPAPSSTAGNDAIIQVENLEYVYQPQNVYAVQGVNFNIRQGDFVAMIGHNGSGKTTVLKNLLGLLKPTHGRVVVAGLDTAQVAVADLARHVGFVLQNPDQQLFAETVEEEIAFGPRNLGLDPAAMKARVDEAIAIVGLETKRQEFPPSLPKGDRAKVVIASALALNPEIIVLDEPTTGQDFKGCHQIMQIANQLHQSGRTVVFVTHHMALVAEYSRRAIVLCQGKLKFDDSTENIFSQAELLRQVNIIPPQITELGQRLPASLGLPRNPLTVQQLSEPILAALAVHS